MGRKVLENTLLRAYKTIFPCDSLTFATASITFWLPFSKAQSRGVAPLLSSASVDAPLLECRCQGKGSGLE